MSRSGKIPAKAGFVRLAASALALAALADSPAWAQDELSAAEVRVLLEEREAAIVRLEATIRDLSTRLERLERAAGAAGYPALPAIPAADLSAEPPVPAAGNGGLAIDEAAAERALERVLSQEGALLLPAWTVEIAPSLSWSYSQRDYPVARLVGDTLVIGSNVAEQNAVAANLDARIGLPLGAQLELGMPFRWIDEDLSTRVLGAPTGDSASRQSTGFGGLRIGLAKTLVRESGWRPDVVARIAWDTGLGDDSQGDPLDRGGRSLTGSLAFVKRSDPVVFFGSAGYRRWLGDAPLEPGDRIDVSLGAALAASPSTTLFASVSNQFAGEAEFEGRPVAGSGLTAASLSIGAGTIVGRGVLLNLVASMGVTDDAPDYAIGVSSSIRID